MKLIKEGLFATIIVVIILVIIVVFSIISIIKNKGKCSCGCSNCAFKDSCKSKK